MKSLKSCCAPASLIILLIAAAPALCETAPHNIIFFIGDGMGSEHIRAARLVLGQPLVFERFSHRGDVTTFSANSSITDSAAASTAMATGHKVNNGVISTALPGDGMELETLLEYFEAAGKSGGLITTTTITDATPAGFGAHEASRSYAANIARDYLDQTRPAVLLGGGNANLSSAAAQAAGYTVVADRAQLLAIDTERTLYVSGQFGGSHMPYEYDGTGPLPHLHEMVNVGLRILDNNPSGFFVVIEGGNIDHAAHQNDLPRMVSETIEFSNAVSEALAWAAAQSDTLIVVTADHETGGLRVLSENLIGGYPTVAWSTTGHTSANVGVFGYGYGAEQFFGTMDNTDFFSLITLAGAAYNQPPAVYAGPDSALQQNESLNLAGSISDDGISGPSGVQARWTQRSGPSAAVFADAASPVTRVSFPAPGSYILELSASDGLAAAADSLTVSVLAVAPTPTPIPTASMTPTPKPTKSPRPKPIHQPKRH